MYVGQRFVDQQCVKRYIINYKNNVGKVLIINSVCGKTLFIRRQSPGETKKSDHPESKLH